ncbi:class I SAM-dependent methyltransferase [Lysobacter sp. S4-A87]|uniref:methyltransferase domain-containing protein n=1 Tax=Lysobacter sp. S4-A87 TaxID=2925843 RepID=UPI001F52D9BF|nr:methyltransferase domain-containing protein [Lysobacter sp. S4-A87]UNK48885.1 class I SAM-dependent methyltransferase [Lysobacter sp. S4-A87]
MDIEEIVEWFNRERRPAMNPGDVQELYFQLHPRTAFLKNLPENARVVDIGAGDGSLSVFKGWPRPVRQDLKMFAYSIEKGEHFDQFEGYEISDWNVAQPSFDGIEFDALVSAHFIEHIADPTSLADWMQRKLRPNGRAYIEWPSEASLSLPGIDEVKRRGVDLMITRFDDDDTHQRLPARDLMRSALLAQGFEIEQEGVIRLPWIENQLMAGFRDADDVFCRQAAFWLAAGWSQFIVARRR